MFPSRGLGLRVPDTAEEKNLVLESLKRTELTYIPPPKITAVWFNTHHGKSSFFKCNILRWSLATWPRLAITPELKQCFCLCIVRDHRYLARILILKQSPGMHVILLCPLGWPYPHSDSQETPDSCAGEWVLHV